MDNFDSAKNYFTRGRQASYLSAAAKAPYHLTAEITVGTSNGTQTGTYEDTWINSTEWRREASIGTSRIVKSQSGDQFYRLAEGTESNILQMVMQILEPIPAEDTMTESDWRIRRDTINGVKTIRVARGEEGRSGDLISSNANGYWFDENNHLVKCVVSGFEVLLENPEEYNGVLVARNFLVLQNGKAVMRVLVKEIGQANSAAAKEFKLNGHEWKRAFTAEVR
jgi:hypothetical protein